VPLVTTASAIRFATDEHGRPVEWPLRGPVPHMVVVGDSGSGVSATIRAIAAGAAALGMDARFCDPKPAPSAEALETRGMTAADGAVESADLISRTVSDMDQRYAQMEAGTAGLAGFRRIVLVVECLGLLQMLSAESLPVGKCSHPALAGLVLLLWMGRAASINVLLADSSELRVSSVLGVDALDQCGTRAALGSIARDTAARLFGGHFVLAGAGYCAPGAGVVLTPGSSRPRRASMLQLGPSGI
jgi:hypothetical protein